MGSSIICTLLHILAEFTYVAPKVKRFEFLKMKCGVEIILSGTLHLCNKIGLLATDSLSDKNISVSELVMAHSDC